MNGKPRLPVEIENQLPEDVVRHIYRFIPYPRKKKTPPVSPSYQRALEALQKSPKRTAMDLYGLDDFVLN
jgi:hypothetical protein